MIFMTLFLYVINVQVTSLNSEFIVPLETKLDAEEKDYTVRGSACWHAWNSVGFNIILTIPW